ncbi:hypothetical protein O0235_10635 [Tepidiforma flava]|uniref:ABC transmembrane type-1 domain-containing protein n=1 Tax=Tepidiforma flava TaxID=3004094 RepID=A0ABY7M3R6_9CHLR|nr:hypothetical protein [Tepidiforma flava]WBL35242.1 hypothetical protein O0235_10635 [Tepidiforma flava]
MGFFRGWVDMLVSRAIEVVLGFPPLVLAIFFLSIFNPERGYSLRLVLLMVSLAIGIIITPTTARIVLGGAVLSIRNLQYVEAAESSWGTAPCGSCGGTCSRTSRRRSSSSRASRWGTPSSRRRR